MPLNVNALLTLNEAKEALGIGLGDTSQDAVVEGLINRVSDYAETYTGRKLKERTYTNLRADSGAALAGEAGLGLPYSSGSAQKKLLIIEWPIVSVATLEYDDVVQTVWLPGDAGKPQDKDVYVVDGADARYARHGFYRWNGWRRGVANVKLSTFVAGYGGVGAFNVTIPEDLRQGAVFAVADWYHKRDKSRWGVQSRSIGGETISFSQAPIPPETERLWASYVRLEIGVI